MRSAKDLHDYQKKAILRIVNEPQLALFIGLGLGKTAISLFAIKRLLQDKKIRNCLVVAPIRVVYSVWRQEAKMWDYTQNLDMTILHGPEKNGRYAGQFEVYLTNYESLAWITDKMRTDAAQKIRKFDMVIFDESTKMKSPKTQRFKRLKGLIKLFHRRYILTATPIPNHLSDIWSQMFILDAGETLGTAFTTFQRKYFYEVSRYIWTTFPDSNQNISNLISPKCIRLNQKDYLTLPDITYNTIPVQMPASIREQYIELEKEFFIELEEGVNIEIFNAVSLMMKLRQIIQGAIYGTDPEAKYQKHHILHTAKLDALSEIIEQNSQPVIIPIQFRFDWWMIKERFPQAEVIAGGVSMEDSQSIIDRWNQGKVPMLICHPASMAHGVNLQQGGNFMIWYAMTHSLEHYDQLIGRIYRQGQTDKVVIHHLVMEDTIDGGILLGLRNKATTQLQMLTQIQKFRQSF